MLAKMNAVVLSGTKDLAVFVQPRGPSPAAQDDKSFVAEDLNGDIWFLFPIRP